MKTLNKIYLVSFLIGGMVTLVLFALGQNAKTSTNENPFSSQPYVYAGVDDKICDSDNFIVKGTNTYKTMNIWHTDGDGIFINPYNLTTLYIPGKADLAKGNVVLSLHLLMYKGIADIKTYDEMVLSFGKCKELEDPK